MQGRGNLEHGLTQSFCSLVRQLLLHLGSLCSPIVRLMRYPRGAVRGAALQMPSSEQVD
jgi:hypothetical protein